jgi:hypothetical protein
MTEYDYLVQVPLPGGGGWMTICSCDQPANAGAVVTALIAAGTEPAAMIQVVTVRRLERRV